MRSTREIGMTSVGFRRAIVGIGVFIGLVAAAAGQTPPGPPVAYEEQEVTFTSGEVKLAGTVTLPVAKPAVAGVVLLTGSGAQNRDEELFGFRPFRVFADHLAKAGIAVLRYDDRGVGGSTGSVPASTTRDFAGDALAGLALLKTRVGTSTPIGLLGHSEGAIVAALAAADSRDVSFIVWMAGSSERGDAVLRRQAEDLTRAAGASDAVLSAILAAHRKLTETVRAGADRPAIMDAIRALVRAQLELAPPAQRQMIGDFDAFAAKMAESAAPSILSPWSRAFMSLDPAEALAKVSCPVLALFGERDMQVPPAANRPPLEAALARAGNSRVSVKMYAEANHLFIKSVTGNPTEYATLEKVFVPGLLDDVSGWILAQVKR